MRSYQWNPDDRTVDVNVSGHVRKLEHLVKHSPDGFMCGYGGSGPADLALSILADLIGADEATKWYQAFKWDIISQRGPMMHWTLSEEHIQTWLAVARQRKTQSTVTATAH